MGRLNDNELLEAYEKAERDCLQKRLDSAVSSMGLPKGTRVSGNIPLPAFSTLECLFLEEEMQRRGLRRKDRTQEPLQPAEKPCSCVVM